jgi:hypothetical protein
MLVSTASSQELLGSPSWPLWILLVMARGKLLIPTVSSIGKPDVTVKQLPHVAGRHVRTHRCGYAALMIYARGFLPHCAFNPAAQTRFGPWEGWPRVTERRFTEQ